jgi:predicted DCC family thiol-disulfide oxidoreductase YuxK
MFIAKLYSPHRVYLMFSVGKFVLCDMPATVKMSFMTTEISIESTASPLATVYFDGGCPICSREIGFYQRQSGADQIAWVDLTTCPDSALPQGISRQAAMARFHVATAAGITSGAAGFVALWRTLPRFRFIGRLLSIPPMPWILERGYRIFLRIRPTRKLADCDVCIK